MMSKFAKVILTKQMWDDIRNCVRNCEEKMSTDIAIDCEGCSCCNIEALECLGAGLWYSTTDNSVYVMRDQKN